MNLRVAVHQEFYFQTFHLHLSQLQRNTIRIAIYAILLQEDEQSR